MAGLDTTDRILYRLEFAIRDLEALKAENPKHYSWPLRTRHYDELYSDLKDAAAKIRELERQIREQERGP